MLAQERPRIPALARPVFRPPPREQLTEGALWKILGKRLDLDQSVKTSARHQAEQRLGLRFGENHAGRMSLTKLLETLEHDQLLIEVEWLGAVLEPHRLEKELLAEPFEGERLVLLETPGPRPLAAIPEPGRAVLVLVGPAGGWEPNEVGRLEAAGFHAVGLGPRVLRSETAAVAAVVMAQTLWGDLG